MTHDVVVGFNQFADSALNISLIHWWKGFDYKEYIAGMEGMHLAVKSAFEEQGIGFAFPSRTIYLRQEGDWKLKAPAEAQEG